MPAHVDEGIDVPRLVARDDDRDRAGRGREPVARLGHLVDAAGVLPRALENRLLLVPQDLRVRVPRRGQGRARAEGVSDLLDVVDHAVIPPAYGAIPRLKSPPAMITRWISLVPSQIRS